MSKTLPVVIAALMLSGVTAVDAKPAPRREKQAARDCAANLRPDLQQLLRTYPNGGDDLATAITGVLNNDASAASGVVALAQQANTDQKAAIALGFFKAMQGADAARTAIFRTALASCSNPAFAAMVASMLGQSYAEAGGNRGGSGGTVFSPGGGGFGPGRGPGFGNGNPPVSPN